MYMTELESKILQAFNTEYEFAEDEKSDNVTYTMVDEIVERTGIETNIVKGVLGSLVKKGLVCTDGERNDIPKCVLLSDTGIDAYYSTL